MYTAPPEETHEETNDASEETESEGEGRVSELETTPATTDANWTGTVPADD
jgi:hypothetical protein